MSSMKRMIIIIDALGYSNITEKSMAEMFRLFQEGNFKSLKTLLGYSITIEKTLLLLPN